MAVQPIPKVQGPAEKAKAKAPPKRMKKVHQVPSSATFLRASCEGVKRLGGIHVPEARGGQGNKYRLGVALSRYASQRTELSKAPAGGKVDAAKAAAGKTGGAANLVGAPRPQPAVGRSRRPPQPLAAPARRKPSAPALAHTLSSAPASPRSTHKRRKGLARRRRKPAQPKSVGAVRGGATPRSEGAQGPSRAVARGGGGGAGAAVRRPPTRLELLRQLPPPFTLGVARNARQLPWRI